MWPCRSVVCRIEMQTVSELSAAAARVRVGIALSNPARPANFKNFRRLQNLSGWSIAMTQTSYCGGDCLLNENAGTQHLDRRTFAVMIHVITQSHLPCQTKILSKI